MRLLARQVYSTKALKERLVRRFPEDGTLCDDVVRWLSGLGYLDDATNAAFLARQYAERGFGPRYVAQALRRRGFEPPQALPVATGGLERWYEKKTRGSKPDGRKGWAAVARYLQSKGFGLGEITDFLKGRGMYDRE